MAAQKPPSFKADKLYDFPTRETLVPALKVGALTGKKFPLEHCYSMYATFSISLLFVRLRGRLVYEVKRYFYTRYLIIERPLRSMSTTCHLFSYLVFWLLGFCILC